MTTARDVIAKGIYEYERRGDNQRTPFEEHPNAFAYYGVFDKFIAAARSAPDSVRLELAALLNPWRPIETAPKDGTDIWLGRGVRRLIGFWQRNEWVDHCSSGVLCITPTHWLPLPAPPSEDKA